ncbi:MAG: hypothetical protein OEU80_06590 [Deltaproteobacteria bacterium]|jgi:hypothetical protein|nr:hypothetical protein [Deltaproteobacteria bacterium]MDH3773800.1 hypothetical protein [Deltaproteobacteria bacterium]MDH3801739.1 hypothetical protein [Deltaproteobacteria bacterium]MDH3851625.1 hypothetical protein [Deltaproteobacteria bacterium]MDH3898169.1 hypothetical protein [Deltaproteobacteria bacterium]
MLNKRRGKLFLVFTALIMMMGCSTADLSTDNLRDQDAQPDLREKAITIFERSLNARGGYDTYKSFNSVRLRGTDLWHSSFVRFFTPVTEQAQKFEVKFSIAGNDIKYLFSNGKRKGQFIGVEDGKPYKAIEGEKEFTDSSKIRIYLEPLTHYFKWPFNLYESPVLLYAGEREIENETYQLLFASSGGVAASPEHDQYVIYINKKTYHVDYIDFTLRSLFESYKGTLHYRDFRTVQGLVVPFFIGASDTIENKDFVHEFLFSEIQFITSP